MIWARTDTSSAETGSSSTMRRVSVASARAMATRCRWPPLNSWGNSGATSGWRPTSSSTAPTRSRIAARARSVWISSGSAMMSCTRMRGLSELNGSWNTTCTARRYAMSSLPSRPAMSRPSKAIAPAVGVSCRRINLEVVVFPHPDSPMRPSVSPGWMAKSTPSTAFTHVPPRPSSPCRKGKCFFSPRTSRMGDDIVQEPAPGDASGAEVDVAWLLGLAARHGFGTARMEGTSRRQVRQIRRLARDRIERLLAAELGHRAEQGPRVRMPGLVEQLPHRRLLDDLAGVHHGDPVAHLRDDAQVVRHEDQGHARLPLDVLEEIEVLRLDGDVEVRRGLVGDDDPRPSGQRDRPHDALAHAAAHLMRVVAHPPLGRGDADGVQELPHALAQRAAPQVLVEERGLRHLPPDREERVQRRHRVLEDHGDLSAPDPAQLALALARQILALEDDAPAHDAGGPRQEPDDREARRRLAAPRFTDEPQGLAFVEREAHAIHRLHDARPAEGEEVCLEVGHLQNRGHAAERALEIPELGIEANAQPVAEELGREDDQGDAEA